MHLDRFVIYQNAAHELFLQNYHIGRFVVFLRNEILYIKTKD